MKSYRFLLGLAAALNVSTVGECETVVDGFVIPGAGGIAASAAYSVHASVGQPSAGSAGSTTYGLTTGFWSILGTVATPGAPELLISRNEAVVTISWPVPASGWILDRSPVLGAGPGSWTEVASGYQTNATHISVTIQAPVGNAFFRLRKQ